jgi:hypothetical protein
VTTEQFRDRVRMLELENIGDPVSLEGIQSARKSVLDAFDAQAAELAALRPLKPIAEAAIAYIQARNGPVPWREVDGLLGTLCEVTSAYLAAQEGGTK